VQGTKEEFTMKGKLLGLSFLFLFLFVVANVSAEELPYWIEHDNSNGYTQTSNIWVNVSNTNKTLYVYYNGNSVNTKNNGNLVFPFFDDFIGGEINSSVSIANKTGGNLSFSGSIANFTAPSTNKHNIIRSKVPINCETAHAYMLGVGAYGWVGFGGIPYFNASYYGWPTPYTNQRTDGYITQAPASTPNTNMLTALTGYSTFTVNKNATNVTGYTYNSTTSRHNVTTSTNPITNKYVYVGTTNSGTALVDYFFCSNWNVNFTITKSYGVEENGSWTVNGITYDKRKALNLSSNINTSSYLTGYQIPIPYSQFNNSNISVYEYDPTPTDLIEISSPTAQNYTTQNVMINISNKTSMANIDEIWYNWNGTNVTYTEPINLTFTAGEHTLETWANNTAGTEQNVNVTFAVYTPPSESDITQPEDLVFGYYTLTWTESIVDYGTIDYYNVSFFGDTEYEVYSGALLTTSWNTTEIPNQEGYLQMEVCSDVGLCNVTTTTNFTINNFNVTLVEPSGNGTFVGDTYFEIVRDGTDAIWCDLYGDSDVLTSKILYNGTNNWNGTTSLISTVTEVYVECYMVGYSSVVTTQVIDFAINNTVYTLDYEKDLIGYGNVFNTPQNLFYDTDGDLNIIFFSLLNETEYFNVIKVNSTDVITHYSTELVRPMNYMNVFIEESETIVMMFNSTGNGRIMAHLYPNGTTTINTYAFDNFTVVDRSEMLEPAQIINTNGLPGIAGGFYLIPIPNSTTSWHMFKKVVGSDTLTNTTQTFRGYSIGTSLKANDFTDWYVAGGNPVTTANVQLLSFDGTTFTQIINASVDASMFINDTYKTKVRFSESHFVIFQESDAGKPFVVFNLINDSSKYTINKKIEKMTPALYINDDIFSYLTSAEYTYEIFLTNGTFNVPAGVTKVELLVVAGGGGGGYRTGGTTYPGGGGGGGLIYIPEYSVTPGQAIPVTIGTGGIGGWNTTFSRGLNGGNSTFGSLLALGGGGGGGLTQKSGNDGGSGGGGYSESGSKGQAGMGLQTSQAGSSGTYGYGNNGSAGLSASPYTAGGGGGAGGVGTRPTGGSGLFVLSNIYAIGGTGYAGGSHAQDNTGNGGNGASADNSNGRNGGSGIVIVKYKTTGGSYAICNDNGVVNCTWYTTAQYGFDVPMDHYPLSAQYINDGTNKVTYGKTYGGDPLKFVYNENLYDAKFQCLDEMAEHNLVFNFTVMNSGLGTVYQVNNNMLGYVIPSTLLGVGLKDIETTCNTSVARGYFLGLDDNYLMDFYGLEESKGLYYTINIVNAFGNPVPGVYLTAQRFSPSKTAFTTIQQEVTDTNGDAIFFLEPTIPYKLLVIQDNVTIATLSFVPGSSANIELSLGSTANPVPFTDGDLVFDDVTFGVTPYVSFFTEDLNITYTVSSAESKLDEVGMIITKKNSSGTYTVYNNSLNSPAGASFDYTFNSTGSYVVTYYFNHEDYDIYQNVLLYQYGRNSSMSLISEGLLDVGFSGWAYYLFAVVISGLVIGFMSRYSWEGASIMGLLILWAFSIFAPAGMYITEFALADGGVWYIGFIEVTTLTTLVVLALLYRRSTV